LQGVFFRQNEIFTFLHLIHNNVKIENFEFPLDYSHSRNGIARFDKSFLLADDHTKTVQIINNTDLVDESRLAKSNNKTLFPKIIF